MKLSTIVSELLTDFRLKDILKSGLLKITALLILAAWVVPAGFDSYLHPDKTFFGQLFNPTTLDIYLRSSISILFGGLGLLTILGFNRIGKQHQDLMFERAKLSQIIESGPQCIKTVAKDGSLIEMNPAGLMMIEAESLDLVQGQSVYNLIAEEDRDAYIDFNKRIFDGHSEVTTYDIVGLEGTRKRVESHAVPLFDDNGQVRAHLAMTRDITQSHKLAEELSYQASHDMLTGLINRQEFERRLENTLTLAITDQSHHAIFFIDLDQFKLVNDTCGHMAGDELLRQVAAIMTHQVRQQDSVARMGGDEFAILLQYCCLDEARNIAEKLRQEVEAFIFP
ncbi:MAG: diguanylate cyclase, partial [Pseudomonadota bacterium]|nr:diguanylate cyclase [Pseudomonadota bacterium]